jgi:hypothetical protein
MDRVARRGAVLALLSFIGGIALPATGVITPTLGFWLLGFAGCLVLTEIVYSVWGTQVHGLLLRSPIGLQSPVTRRRGDGVVIPPADAPLGFLDFQVRFERAIKEATRSMNELGKDLAAGLRMSNKHLPRMQKAATASSEDQLRVSRDYGRSLGRFTTRLDRDEARFRNARIQIAENGLSRIRAFPHGTDLTTFRGMIESIRNPTAEGLVATREYRQSVASMRKVGVQQEVNAATDRLLMVIDRWIEDYVDVVRFGDEALAEIAARSSSAARSSPTTPRSRRRSRRGR